MRADAIIRSVERVVTRMIRVHPKIADPENQHKTRLLSGLLLVTILIMLIIISLVIFFDPDDLLDIRTLTAMFTICVSVLSYIANYLGYYQFSNLVFIGYLSVIFLAIPYAGPYAEFMPFAIVPIFLVGMFYKWKQTTVYAIIVVITTFFLNALVIDRDVWDRRIIWYFLLFASGLIVIFKGHLTVLEAIRHKQIEEANLQRERHQFELILQREKSDTFRTLVGSIAHDIRTPLSIINTSLYLIEKYEDGAKKEEKLSTIRAQLNVLDNFTEDLLTMARLESEPQPQLTQVDVNKLVQGIEQNYNGLAENKKVSLYVELDESIATIAADPADLERAITNLVGNAINYTPEENNVIIRTQRTVDNVVIEVADTGIGINENDLPHIFDRFYRSSEAKTISTKGTGLGLSIVKRIIEMHQGMVEVESIPGKGSTFRIHLPVNPSLVQLENELI